MPSFDCAFRPMRAKPGDLAGSRRAARKSSAPDTAPALASYPAVSSTDRRPSFNANCAYGESGSVVYS